jgi:hypothetical protein
LSISLKIILDELKYEYEWYGDSQENPSFECANLLTGKENSLSEDRLLVGLLSEAISFSAHYGKGPYFICVHDLAYEEVLPPGAMDRMVVIKENKDIRELFNEIQQVFVRINKWIMDMQVSVVQNKGIQEIITLSERIVGNHISVMDPTFKLLAHTKNVEIDDPVTNELVKYGYHPEETVKRFQLTRRIEQFEKAEDLIVNHVSTMTSYPVVIKVYRFKDTYSILVVMVCHRKGITDGLLDLFRIMLEYLRIYIDREYSQLGGFSTIDPLLTDLLDKKIEEAEEAKCRASCLGIPFYGRFDLFKLVFQDDMNTPISRIIRELAMLLPKSKLFCTPNILVLNLYKDHETLRTQETRLEFIWNTMKGQLSCCGISNLFDSLWELPNAYEQAGEAIKIGSILKNKHDCPGESKAGKNNYRFEEYYIYHMLDTCLAKSPELFRHGFVFEAIRKLKNYEKKHNTEVFKLLRTFLRCERKATETSALLHLHRNTVLYHIQKIEEMLGVKLDDPEIRLKLLLAAKVADLEGS